MQFSKFLVAAAAFAVSQALVQFTDPAGSFPEITAGKSFNFTWSDAVGPVTLTLENGGANNLQPVTVLASGLSGTSWVWNVPSDLTADTYAVKITDGTTTNYSEQFQLIGGVTSTSSTASSTSSSGSSASSGSSTTSSSGSSSSSTSSSSASTTPSSSKTSSTKAPSTTSSAAGASSSTSAPKSSGSSLASPLAFVFLALAAFFTIN